MPKVISSQELDQIVELIGQYADGIGVEWLVQAIDPGMPRRTLQRRLASLIVKKRIVQRRRGAWVTLPSRPSDGRSFHH